MNNALTIDSGDCFYTGTDFQNFFKVSSQSVVFKANAPDFTILAVSDQFVDLVLDRKSVV